MRARRTPRRSPLLWGLAVAALLAAGSLAAAIDSPPAVLATEAQQIDGFTVRDGYDQIGHTFSDQAAPDAAACLQLCRDNPRCLAFTFEVKREKCHLKDTPNLLRPAPGKVTGFRNQ